MPMARDLGTGWQARLPSRRAAMPRRAAQSWSDSGSAGSLDRCASFRGRLIDDQPGRCYLGRAETREAVAVSSARSSRGGRRLHHVQLNASFHNGSVISLSGDHDIMCAILGYPERQLNGDIQGTWQLRPGRRYELPSRAMRQDRVARRTQDPSGDSDVPASQVSRLSWLTDEVRYDYAFSCYRDGWRCKHIRVDGDGAHGAGGIGACAFRQEDPLKMHRVYSPARSPTIILPDVEFGRGSNSL